MDEQRQSVQEALTELRARARTEVKDGAKRLQEAEDGVLAERRRIGNALGIALDLGLDLSDLAELAGVSVSTVRKWAATEPSA